MSSGGLGNVRDVGNRLGVDLRWRADVTARSEPLDRSDADADDDDAPAGLAMYLLVYGMSAMISIAGLVVAGRALLGVLA